jgi:FkbM family methyltransferase
MTAPAAAAERALCAARLYRPARNTYQRVFNRPYVAYRAAGRRFYGQFVAPGELVFDVGANRGLMAEMFLELGARVVAIEPHPALAATIRRHYPSRRLVVEQTAIGEAPATLPLYVGEDDVHSSISAEWVDRVRGDETMPDRWGETIDVPVHTLDQLVERHGAPVFAKIDIEGYEDKALAGLGRPIRGLSFEYQCPALDMTQRCLDRLMALGQYEFQLAAGETLAFMTPEWMTAADVMERLQQRREREPIAHGDVYARLRR